MNPPTHPWWSTRSFALAMMLASMVPLLYPAIPPLVDLPGHMGRYAVQLAAAESPLHQWYRFEWAVIGNLGIDLLVMPLAQIFGLELAVKLIVLAIPPLTVGGMLWVAREAHGDVPATAFLALPLVYGYPFQFGFVNFALSIALALLGFALWIRLGRLKRFRLRAAIFVPFGILLWFVHSFGWGVLGLVAYSNDVVRRHSRGKPWLKSAWEACFEVLPLVPPALLMLAWRSGQVSGMTGDWFNWKAKHYFLFNVLRNDGTAFDLWSGIGLIALAAMGIFGLGFRRSPRLLLAGLILLAAFVLLPRIVLGSAYADMRLAPYMVAILLLAVTPRWTSHRANAAIAALAAGFFLLRMGVQTDSFLRVDRGYREQLAALDQVPRGARVLALTNLPCLGASHWSRMDHLEAMAIVRREAFVNGQWTMAGAQLLRIDYPDAPNFAKDPTQQLRPGLCRQRGSHSWPAVQTQFPRKAFDYLWLINFRPEMLPVADPGLNIVWSGASRGALYRIDPRYQPVPIAPSDMVPTETQPGPALSLAPQPARR
jgi:hypothetical protein